MPEIRAADIPSSGYHWRWREHVPAGMVCGFAGRPGRGKSLTTWHIGAEVSHTGNVLISTAEDPLRQIARPRIEAAGANMDNVYFYTPNLPPLPDGFNEWQRVILKYNLEMVIVDPIAAHLIPNIGHDQGVRQAMTPLADLCEKTGCSFVYITHLVKHVSKNADPLMAVGGAGAGLVAISRVMYLVGYSPDDSDHRVIAGLKRPNFASERESLLFGMDIAEFTASDDHKVYDTGLLRYISTCTHTARDVLDAEAGDPEPTKREMAAEWLADYLWAANKSVPANQIFADGHKLGYNGVMLRRAASDLNVQKSQASGPGTEWSLSDEMREVMDEQRKAPDDLSGL